MLDAEMPMPVALVGLDADAQLCKYYTNFATVPKV
jgi:hypothetical protein